MTSSSLGNTRPSHISDVVFYDFDMFRDAGLASDPHQRVLQISREAPEIFWTPRNGGHWMIVGYEANFEALHDFETFSSNTPQMLESQNQCGSVIIEGRRVPDPYPICLDGSLHRKYRAPLQRVFSPRAVLAYREQIQIIAKELIANVSKYGYCDGIKDIAEPLHFMVFLKIMGLPVDRLDEFRQVIKKFRAPYEHQMEMLERLWTILDVVRDDMLARRDDPRDDIISALWRTEIDGEWMTSDDMENYAVILITAGLETVVNGMGFGIRHLASDLSLQDRLRADAALIAETTEELLRRYTFTAPMRIIAQDTEFRGCTMKRGDRVVPFLSGANLDEEAFPEPESFDLNRLGKAHIAFGAGFHRCVGSHLARIELQLLYETILTHLPKFRLDPDKAVHFHCGHGLGIESLPLVWGQ